VLAGKAATARERAEKEGENEEDLTAVLEISTGGSGTAWLQPIDDGEVRRPAVKKMAIALLRCLRAREIHRRGAARGSRGDGRLEEARRARWLQIRLTAARGVLGAARERAAGERGADREGVRGGRGCRGIAEGDQGDEGVARQARRSWRGSPARRARSCFGARGGRRRRVGGAGGAGQVGGAGPVLMDHQVSAR